MLPYERLLASPWGNELLEKLTERAIDAEKLGQRGVTDLMTLSFSSNDYVGHALRPDRTLRKSATCVFDPTSPGAAMDFVARKVGIGERPVCPDRGSWGGAPP